jgi:hypothetical protein
VHYVLFALLTFTSRRMSARSQSRRKCDGFLVAITPRAIMAHAILAILLASAIAATFVGRRASNAVSQGRCLVPWILCGRLLRRLSSTIASVIAADRRRRRREEAPDLLRR